MTHCPRHEEVKPGCITCEWLVEMSIAPLTFQRIAENAKAAGWRVRLDPSLRVRLDPSPRLRPEVGRGPRQGETWLVLRLLAPWAFCAALGAAALAARWCG